MKYGIDGDMVMLCADDFENIQVSDVLWVPLNEGIGLALVSSNGDWEQHPPKSFTLGQIVFGYYRYMRKAVAVNNVPIPLWDDLLPEIRDAWNGAADMGKSFVDLGLPYE